MNINLSYVFLTEHATVNFVHVISFNYFGITNAGDGAMLNFHQVLVKPHPTKALGGSLPQTKCANHVFPHLPTRIYATISVIKKLQYNFPKMGGDEGRLEFFQKFIRIGSATLP